MSGETAISNRVGLALRKSCGYIPDLVRLTSRSPGARTQNHEPETLVAFARYPADLRSACVSIVDLAPLTEAHSAVSRCRALGTPFTFACSQDQVEIWRHNTTDASQIASVQIEQLESYLRDHQSEYSPDAIYRAKTWGRFQESRQLSLVDIGLLPVLEAEIGTVVGNLIEDCIFRAQTAVGGKSEPVDGEDLHKVVQASFWLLSGKILSDKNVGDFAGTDLAKVRGLFDKISVHYGTALDISDGLFDALQDPAQDLAQHASLELLTTEALGYVYENTLVSDATRVALGTHSTPPYLVDFVLGNLVDWVSEIPVEQRSVFEPACGHAAFSTSSVRMLTDLLGPNVSAEERRAYLRRRIHGVDIDQFALELARLSLTLADIPNPDGWRLELGDMFLQRRLQRAAMDCTIVLSNPPFENFDSSGRQRYHEAASPPEYSNKSLQMLAELVPHLSEGSVYGFVLPRSVLTSPKAKQIRKLFTEDTEIRDIAVLPDNVFQHSDAETALLLGRKRKPRRGSSYTHRVVREADIDVFRVTGDVSRQHRVIQDDVATEDTDYSLLIPDMHELWQRLKGNPTLAGSAHMAKGLDFKAKGRLDGRVTFSSRRGEGLVPGFVNLKSQPDVHELPERYWLNLDSKVVSTRRSGAEVGTAQVIMNYAPVGRGPWRIRALLDPAGHAVTSRFLVIRPLTSNVSTKQLWAILNSPIANAYAYSYLGKRDLLVGTMRRLPLPLSSDLGILDELVDKFFDSLSEGVVAESVVVAYSAIDEAVLSLYDLDHGEERELLNLFEGHPRDGVRGASTSIFPSGLPETVSLSQYRDWSKDWEAVNSERIHLIEQRSIRALDEAEVERLAVLQDFAEYAVSRAEELPIDRLVALKRRFMPVQD